MLLVARNFAVGLAVVVGACAQNPPAAVNAAAEEQPDAYTLSPIIGPTGLEAVEVTLSFEGDGDGSTIVELPVRFADQQDLWRHVSHLSVEGGRIASSSAVTRTIEHCPDCRVILRYRVDSAYRTAPAKYAKGGATIWPDRIASYGEALFATVKGHDRHHATFEWPGWPENWTRVSDLDHGQTGRALTVADIVESTVLAGPEVRVFRPPMSDGSLTVGVLDDYDFDTGDFVQEVAKVIAAQRMFWGDWKGPFTVVLYPIRDEPGRSSLSGTGRSDAFVLESTANLDLATMTRLIAHEHNHSWIPRRVGEFSVGPKEPESYWLSEGFTDFYTARSLVSAELWTSLSFAEEFNSALRRYDRSPVRDSSNNSIGHGFWADQDIQQLPYDRGRLFALFVDYHLRKLSRGERNFDDLILLMRQRWAAAPIPNKPELRAGFVDAAATLGLNVRPWLEIYIDQGKPIELPPDLFGPCGRLEVLSLPKFEPGFDRSASTSSGIISGVDPNGPAYRAGLRNDMQRIDHISSKEGDPRIRMIYRVADKDGERPVGWLPAGKSMVSVRELSLGPEADKKSCHSALGGGAKSGGSRRSLSTSPGTDGIMRQ